MVFLALCRYHNDTLIPMNDRRRRQMAIVKFGRQSDTVECVLEIDNVQAGDGGKYRIESINSVGSSQSIGELLVYKPGYAATSTPLRNDEGSIIANNNFRTNTLTISKPTKAAGAFFGPPPTKTKKQWATVYAKKCLRCNGTNGHQRAQCPAGDVTCHRCYRMGHIAAVCPNPVKCFICRLDGK